MLLVTRLQHCVLQDAMDSLDRNVAAAFMEQPSSPKASSISDEKVRNSRHDVYAVGPQRMVKSSRQAYVPCDRRAEPSSGYDKSHELWLGTQHLAQYRSC